MTKAKAADLKSGKIKSLEELVEIIQKAKAEKRRVVQCHGVFDLLHPGHIVHFQEAREFGDLLVVTLTPDRFVNKGPGRPLFNEHLRLETLAAIEHIDYVALNEWPTAIETVKRLRPDFYVKGSDYANSSDDVTGKIREEEDAVKEAGGRLVFTEGFTSSSSSLINRFFSAYPSETQEYLQAIRDRYSADDVIGHLKSLSALKVLVVGEAILDQYCYCKPLGKTPKDTIVSTQYLREESFAGGSVATANHIAGFCGEVALLTTLGPDKKEEEFLRGKLRPNVRMESVRTPERPTVRKRRFLEPNFMTKMFEVQYLDDRPISGGPENEVLERLKTLSEECDLVIVNDFGHGMLTPKVRDFLSGCGKFLALNTQTNSANHGYNTVTNYKRADYVAIDGLELQLASGDRYGDFRGMIGPISEKLGVKNFLVSLGREGVVMLTGHEWGQAPALAVRVVDRVGAGDALFSLTSPCAYKGVPPELICFIGNCVGALAVEIVCNRESIDSVGLYKFIQTLLKK